METCTCLLSSVNPGSPHWPQKVCLEIRFVPVELPSIREVIDIELPEFETCYECADDPDVLAQIKLGLEDVKAGRISKIDWSVFDE